VLTAAHDDAGFVSTMTHKLSMIMRNLPAELSFPSPQDPATRIVLLIQVMIIPLVLVAEVLETVCSAVLTPGSDADESLGKAFMGGAILVIAFLLTGAFGLR